MSNESPISVALSDVAEGKMHALSAGGREIVICRTKEGIYALDNICTHAYARLNEGRLRGNRLICPLHGAAFDVRDGRVLGAPASQPLASHAVTVVDERIEITVAPATANSISRNVLSGIRVLDFGRYVAGPYCATLLGFLGADVIRIERRDGGEDRFIAPVTDGGEGGVFFQTACGKRSVTLDPGKAGARELVARLVATADVVVANLPAVQLRAMGIDYETLRAVRPDIILTTQTAFGDKGPYANRGGFDGVGQAMSGAMYISGEPGAPAKAAAPYVDFGTAVLCALGTLAAILHRERTGEGQEVKGTLLGTALATFGSHLAEQGATAINRVGSGNRVQTSAPSAVFPTRDGHVLTHVVGNGLFRRWAKLMGDEARWTGDALYHSDDSRGAHSQHILQSMAAWCAARTTSETLEALNAAGLPAGPIYTPQQALDDPQVAAMKLLHSITGYPGLHRPVPVCGLPVELSVTPGTIPQRPPLLGEHTDAVLRELGYSPVEIAALREQGVV